ncbi:peptidoglycan-binding protein, partial [Patescibacteria group bacterium]|nr:peptidoglycan-binding protein [Patescibacteria group bacterium]
MDKGYIKVAAWKKIAVTISTAAVLSGAVAFMPLVASADLLSDLQAQIAALTAQLNALKGGATTGGTAACTFTRALTVGSRGADVTCLQNYLASGGYLGVSATGFFGNLTKAAVAKWQAAMGVSPAAGYFGKISQAKFASMASTTTGGTTTGGTTTGGTTTGGTTTGGTTTTTVGKGLTVTAPAQPDANIVPFNTARVPFTNVDFTASSDGDVTVNSVTVERGGIGVDSAISSVVLLDRDTGLQIGLSKTINSNHQSILNTPFVVKAGSTRHIAVAVNRPTAAGANGGQIIRLNVIAVDAGSSTVNGSLPVMGTGMTINETLTVGTATLVRGPMDPGSSQTEPVGTTGYVFSSLKVTAGSGEDLWLKSISWNNSGSVAPADMANVMVYVDGTAYTPVVSTDGKYFTATFPENSGKGLDILKGNSREIWIKGDIAGGSGRTVNFDLYRYTDMYMVGQQYGYGVTPTAAEVAAAADDGKFHSANPNYDGFKVTVANGTMNVEKATTVAAQNIAINLSAQPLGGFNVEAKGEPISVASSKFHFMIIRASGAAQTPSDMTNIALYDDTGKIVAGPKDGTDDAAGLNTGYVTFTDTITYPIGKHTYTLKGKLGTDFKNNDTIQASTTPGTDWTSVTGQVTGNSITPSPSSELDANTMTVKSAATAISASGNPVAQNVVGGANGFTFANYVFDASASGEDVRFTSANFEFNVASGNATDLTSCTWYDGATALNTGTNVLNPVAASVGSSTVITFDNNLLVPKGTLKTVSAKCNIKGGATGKYEWGISGATAQSATGLTSGQSFTPTVTASQGQLMTASANGSLTITLDTGTTPPYKLVAANTTGNVVTSLKFHATNEAINVKKIALQMSPVTVTASSSVTDIAQFTVWNGATQIGAGTFVGTSRNATSTFTQDFVVPKDGDALLTVKIDTAMIGTSQVGTSGALLKVDWDGDDAGTTGGTIGIGASSGATIAGGSVGNDTATNGVRLFKAYPVVSVIPFSGTGKLTSGRPVLFQFSVTAVNGPVGISTFMFRIATSSAT